MENECEEVCESWDREVVEVGEERGGVFGLCRGGQDLGKSKHDYGRSRIYIINQHAVVIVCLPSRMKQPYLPRPLSPQPLKPSQPSASCNRSVSAIHARSRNLSTTTYAQVVLPAPGGPHSSVTFPRGSPRCRPAEKTASFASAPVLPSRASSWLSPVEMARGPPAFCRFWSAWVAETVGRRSDGCQCPLSCGICGGKCLRDEECRFEALDDGAAGGGVLPAIVLILALWHLRIAVTTVFDANHPRGSESWTSPTWLCSSLLSRCGYRSLSWARHFGDRDVGSARTFFSVIARLHRRVSAYLTAGCHVLIFSSWIS